MTLPVGQLENQGFKKLLALASPATTLHLNTLDKRSLYLFTGQDDDADWFLPPLAAKRWLWVKNACGDNGIARLNLHVEGGAATIWPGGLVAGNTGGPPTDTFTLFPGWAAQLYCDGAFYAVRTLWDPDFPSFS